MDLRKCDHNQFGGRRDVGIGSKIAVFLWDEGVLFVFGILKTARKAREGTSFNQGHVGVLLQYHHRTVHG